MNVREKALRTLCGSDSRFRLFQALYAAPEREYHLRGLAAAASVDPSHVHKLLPEMLSAGLCEQVEAAPYPKYRAKKDHPLFGRLADLFQHDAGQPAGELQDVEIKDAPVLRSLLWTGKQRAQVPAREAFQHYERNWRFVRRAPISAKEQKLIDRLAKAYGGGLING
jgi:hypothetical protein